MKSNKLNYNNSSYPYNPIETDIDIRENPYTIFELKRRCDKQQIIVNPELQQNSNIWDEQQRSKFIESIILNFPLPYWYVKQTRNGKYIIVDGLQRTLTINKFMNDEFQLTNLESLPQLNGYNFSGLKKLKGNYETRIEDKKISLYVIRPSTHPRVVYDIYERVNTERIKLNHPSTVNYE
jgi:hypothetical protein